MPLPQGSFDLAYSARINHFRGESRLQLEWIDFRITETISPQIHTDQPEIVDYRHTADSGSKLNEILSLKSVQIWAEGKSPPLGSKKRHELDPAEELVIWSIPPSPDMLRQALERVSPRRVYLFGNNPKLDQPKVFLDHLAGLAKYAIGKYSGKTSIEELAAASAHCEGTVQKGLDWLVAQGLISIRKETVGSLLLEKDGYPDKELSESLLNDIKDLLLETEAYRNHYLSADMETLL
jgi:single-stranded-DNA-specific exonuclease